MNPPNSPNTKWIALSVLVLFILSGGVYRLSHRASKDSGHSMGTQEPKKGEAPAGGQDRQATKGAPSGQNAGDPGKATALSGETASSPRADHVTGSDSPASRHAGGSADHPAAATRANGSSDSSWPSSPAGNVPLVLAPSALTDAARTGAPSASAPAAPAVPQDSCVTVSYRHKALATHGDEESCSHHKNLLRLGRKDANAKTVCVRVNGTPVHYLSVKGHPDEFIFGSIAGPKSKVTVTYCTGRLKGCGDKAVDDCTVPKDEFMEAIGGAQEGKGDARLGQWDPSQRSEREADVMAKLDGEVKRELETNDDLNGRAPAGEMFKDWIAGDETAACGTKQAGS